MGDSIRTMVWLRLDEIDGMTEGPNNSKTDYSASRAWFVDGHRGLMIIGTISELRDFAELLLEAADDAIANLAGPTLGAA